MSVAIPKPLGSHDRYLASAVNSARQLIGSQILFGLKKANECDPDLMPTTALVEVAGGVLHAILSEGARDISDLVPYFAEAPEVFRNELLECSQGVPPRPENCGPLIERILRYNTAKRRQILLWNIAAADERGEPTAELTKQLAEIDAGGDTRKSHSLIVSGVNSFPTESPPETILLGNGWMRLGDIATFISTAGAGKSVAVTQGAMAWGLGLPYLGIRPARPLRILLFSGEDDGVTIGQCREGFLEHSEAITGRQLAAKDLDMLDGMLRTEFSREYVGPRFHSHLGELLRESPVDLVIVNPLLSYIGGEIVACASEWLRAGIMPILQQHNCAALIAHHTGKMAKDGWDNTDDTYSAIGGGEIANIPRSILTLRPTTAEGLSVVKVSKRQTTGWKDGEGNFSSCYFVKRSGNPERPAWIPVGHDDAEELIAEGTPSGNTGKPSRKAMPSHVVDALQCGPTQRRALIERVMKSCKCSDRTASEAILSAESEELISSFTETNPRGGNPIKWLRLPKHSNQ